VTPVRNPLVYEINTWVWLTELRERFGKPLTLDSIPAEAIDEIANWHPHYVWLMGVWERSPRSREIAQKHPDLQAEYERALPGFTAADVVGSPYAIRRYAVDPYFGGREALAAFRARLRERGIGLILDYVPNHVAVDHPWTVDCPACLVHGTEVDIKARSTFYFRVPENGAIIAHGRDPYFPAWTDTAQVDAFAPEGRAQSRAVVMDIAEQCDGARCDMVMLLVNSVFARVWNRPPDAIPPTEFWQEIIPPVKAKYPDFMFMAEVYWDMEAEMQSLGFDYTYDKRLYDRLRHENVHTVRDHLLAASSYQRKLVRFIENHDEARAVTAFGVDKSRMAAVVTMALPGAKLFHEGQFEGRRARLPVQLGRRPAEPTIEALRAFYQRLLNEIKDTPYRDGVFMTLAVNPFLSGDTSDQNMLAFAWALGDDWRIIVANDCDQPVRGRVMLPRPAFAGLTAWRFDDMLDLREPFLRIGDDVLIAGLPLELEPYGARIFVVTRSA